MRILVLGAGALGSIIAGPLARSDEDVVLLTRGEKATVSPRTPALLVLMPQRVTLGTCRMKNGNGPST